MGGQWDELRQVVGRYSIFLLLLPIVALALCAAFARPVQLADLLNWQSATESFHPLWGKVLYVGIMTFGAAILALFIYSVSSLDRSLLGRAIPPRYRLPRLLLWQMQPGNPHRSLVVASWSFNILLLVILTTALVITRSTNTAASLTANFAPLTTVLVIVLFGLHLGAALAISHLALRERCRMAVLYAWSPTALLLLGLFASGERNNATVWLAAGLVCGAIYLHLAVSRLFPAAQGSLYNLLGWGALAGIIYAFNCSQAAVILIVSIWCLIAGFGVVSVLPNDGTSRIHEVLRWSAPALGCFAVVAGSVTKRSFEDCCMTVNPAGANEGPVQTHDQVLSAAGERREITVGGQDLRLPVSMLCFAGGGSRAAIFGALAYERLYWLKFPREDLSKELARNYEGLRPQELALLEEALPPGVRREVFQDGFVFPGRLLLAYSSVSSSVSGGSLAWARIAAFMAQPVPGQTLSPPELRLANLKRLFGWAGTKLTQMLDSGLAPSQDLSLTCKQFERDTLLRDMSGHFLSSVVNGAFSPFDARRRAIMDHWNEAFGWRDTRLGDMRKHEASGLLPVSIFNTTLANTGERVVLTNLSAAYFRGLNVLGPRPIANPVQRESSGSSAQSTVHAAVPGLAITHTLLDPEWNPEWATAVWLSSCFPFGFARAPLEQSLFGEKIRLMDGGVVDNTGLDSCLSLLRGLSDSKPAVQKIVKQQPGVQIQAQISQVNPIASQIPVTGNERLPEADTKYLAGRSVFLLTINSSELPVEKTSAAPGWANYKGTSDSVWRADRVRDAILLSGYLAVLDRMLGESEPRFTISSGPNADKRVLDGFRYPMLADLTQGVEAGPVSEQLREAASIPTYIHGYERKSSAGEKAPWALFLIRPGESAKDHVATSWHLPQSERLKLYRAGLDQKVTDGLRNAAVSYLSMILREVQKTHLAP